MSIPPSVVEEQSARDRLSEIQGEIRRIIECMRSSGITLQEKFLLNLYADGLERLVKR